MRNLDLPPAFLAPDEPGKMAITDMMIDDVRAGHERGSFSVRDLATVILQRIAKIEPFLNAFTVINERLLQDAEGLDADFAEGRHRGALHGIPVVIKDNMNQAGIRTTAGCRAVVWMDNIPSRPFLPFEMRILGQDILIFCGRK